MANDLLYKQQTPNSRINEHQNFGNHVNELAINWIFLIRHNNFFPFKSQFSSSGQLEHTGECAQ
jgi:hypothetical protein